jgi:hypothetical protein
MRLRKNLLTSGGCVGSLAVIAILLVLSVQDHGGEQRQRAEGPTAPVQATGPALGGGGEAA